MATNGLVSIVKDGKTLMKVTAGFNGYEAPVLRALIESNLEKATSPSEVFLMAQQVGFGCKECLVLMYDDGKTCLYDESELFESEMKTLATNFDNPYWNGRSTTGYADYIEIINL